MARPGLPFFSVFVYVKLRPGGFIIACLYMRTRKKTKKNGENKRILLISIVVVIIGVIAFFAYAKINMSKHLETAMREIVITDMAPLNYDRDLGVWNYRVTIALANPSPSAIDVNPGNLELFAGNLSLGAIKPVGDWRISLAPKGKSAIFGDIQLSPATASGLRESEEVDLHVKGNGSMIAKYFFNSSFKDQYWDIGKKLKIY
jgi:hypothetical protein